VRRSIDLGTAVPANVHDPMTAAGDDPPDQQMTMAPRRVFFTAQDRHPASAHLRLQSLDSLQEDGRLGEFVVENTAIVVIEHGFGGQASQLLAQEDIGDPRFLQRWTKLLAVEMLNIP